MLHQAHVQHSTCKTSNNAVATIAIHVAIAFSKSQIPGGIIVTRNWTIIAVSLLISFAARDFAVKLDLIYCLIVGLFFAVLIAVFEYNNKIKTALSLYKTNKLF